VRSAARVFCSVVETLLAAAVMAVGCPGCGGGPDSRALQDGVGTSAAKSTTSDGMPPASPVACAVASEGCPCPRDGETVRCAGPKIHTGNYTSCEPGSRECTQGTWGPCIGKMVYQNADTLTEDYVSPCQAGTAVKWGATTLQGLTPGDSHIDLGVQTADTVAELASAPVVHVATFDGPTNSTWTSADVDALLAASGHAPASRLRITLALVRSSPGGSPPMVVDWRQAMTCVPAQ
jgi:hypothetical protein